MRARVPARTDRTQYLAAKSSLALAAPARDTFRGLQLVAPLNRSLAAKRKALESALDRVSIGGGVQRRGSHHRGQFRDRRAVSPARPRTCWPRSGRRSWPRMSWSSTTCCSRSRRRPSRKRPSSCTRPTRVHARDGIYDDGVKASYAALAKLLPARYGKTEMVGTWTQFAGPRRDTAARAAAGRSATAHRACSAAPAVAPAGPTPRLVSQFERAVKQAESGQAVEAELEFRQLMEAAPDQGGAAYNLGVQLRAAGRLEEAEQAFAAAASRAPRNAPALTELGLTQRQRGKFTGRS